MYSYISEQFIRSFDKTEFKSRTIGALSPDQKMQIIHLAVNKDLPISEEMLKLLGKNKGFQVKNKTKKFNMNQLRILQKALYLNEFLSIVSLGSLDNLELYFNSINQHIIRLNREEIKGSYPIIIKAILEHKRKELYTYFDWNSCLPKYITDSFNKEHFDEIARLQINNFTMVLVLQKMLRNSLSFSPKYYAMMKRKHLIYDYLNIGTEWTSCEELQCYDLLLGVPTLKSDDLPPHLIRRIGKFYL